MKKLILIPFVALLFVAALMNYGTTLVIAADNSVRVSMQEPTGMPFAPGDSFDVSIVLDENPGIYMLDMRLGYDADKMEALGFTRGETTLEIPVLPPVAANPLRFSFEGEYIDKNDSSVGLLITVRFKIKEGVASGTSNFGIISLDAANIMYQKVDCLLPKEVAIKIGEGPITAKTVTGVTVKTQPALAYTQGDALNLSSLVVALEYSDSTAVDVAFANFAAYGLTVSMVNGTLLATAHNGARITIAHTASGFSAQTNPLAVNAGTQTPQPHPSSPPSGGGDTATYTVIFDSNGGSPVSSVAVAAGGRAAKPADPTKDGFTFDGWYSDNGFATAYNFSAAVAGNITLYAKWKESPVEPEQTPDSGATQVQDEAPPGGAIGPGAIGQGVVDALSKMADVSLSHWAASYIGGLINMGIVDGYPLPDGNFEFRPGNEITRAEFFKLVAASLGLPLEEGFDGTDFSDWGAVAEWAKPYIGAVVKAGLVYGSLEDDMLLINANNNISRQETVAIAVRALEIDVPTDGAPQQRITDFEDAGEWAKDAMAFALNNGMINVSGEKCRPTDNAKRDEAAMVLFKMLEYIGTVI